MGNSSSSKVKNDGREGVEVYIHKDRIMPYRTEKMEVPDAEEDIVQKWLDLSKPSSSSADSKVELSPFAMDTPRTPHKIIFDTDIGTDIDDALALLMTLHLPREHVEIIGITTVYGYTDIRTMVAKAIVDAYESHSPGSKIPVIRGESVPMGTHRPVWHTGTEGFGIKDFDILNKMKEDQTARNAALDFDRAGPKFIIEQAHKLNGELELICLGALTNVAYALHMDPTIETKIKKIVYMGMGHRMEPNQGPAFIVPPGSDPMEYKKIYSFFPNHNLSCDTQAAYKVFRSKIPIDVINDTVTNEMWWGANPRENTPGNPCEYLMNLTEDTKTDKDPAEAIVVGMLLEAWLYYRSSIFYTEMKGTCPHDGLTVAEAIYPGKFVRYVRGHVMVHEWAAFTTFVADPNGPHRIGASVDATGFLTWFTKKMIPQFPLEEDYFVKMLNQRAEKKEKAIAESRGKPKAKTAPTTSSSPPKSTD